MTLKIKLYGTKKCHKTQYYKTFLDKKGLDYSVLDVETNDTFAEELKSLYKNRKLNFPTIMLGSKKMRNPSDNDLNKWIEKLK